MKVAAIQATPGKQYKTEKGVTVQMAVSSKVSRLNHTPMLRLNQGKVLVHIVSPEGVVDYTKFRELHQNYFLDDGEAPPLPVKPLPADAETSPLGRRPFPKGPWRGVARLSSVPDALLGIARAAGCYVVGTPNYFRIGFGGKNCFVVFRNGMVALSSAVLRHPDYKALPVVECEERFMPFRIRLEDVTKAGVEEDLMRFIKFLSERHQHGKNARVV
jgi:hypothetical protein